jgi:hypothetical protein
MREGERHEHVSDRRCGCHVRHCGGRECEYGSDYLDPDADGQSWGVTRINVKVKTPSLGSCRHRFVRVTTRYGRS